MKQLFLSNFMRSPNEERLAFKQACCCYQRQFITFSSYFFYHLLRFWVTCGSSWTSSTPAASTLIQASWGWALHGQVSWLDFIFHLTRIKEVSSEIICNLVHKVFSFAVGNESVRKTTCWQTGLKLAEKLCGGRRYFLK